MLNYANTFQKLDEEREENRQLKSMLENRDQKIVELEREIYCLNKVKYI